MQNSTPHLSTIVFPRWHSAFCTVEVILFQWNANKRWGILQFSILFFSSAIVCEWILAEYPKSHHTWRMHTRSIVLLGTDQSSNSSSCYRVAKKKKKLKNSFNMGLIKVHKTLSTFARPHDVCSSTLWNVSLRLLRSLTRRWIIQLRSVRCTLNMLVAMSNHWFLMITLTGSNVSFVNYYYCFLGKLAAKTWIIGWMG